MQLAWMRVSSLAGSQLSWADLRSAVTQADELGFRQIHFDGHEASDFAALAPTKTLRIGLQFGAVATDELGQLRDHVKRLHDQLEGRLVLDVRGTEPTLPQALAELLSALGPQPLNRYFPTLVPHPEVMISPQPGGPCAISHAAAHGFHCLSPAWQARDTLARHWSSFVAGATHAARRACPSQWHVARMVFISENQTEIAAYRRTLIDSYLRPRLGCGHKVAALADALILAGPAHKVAPQRSQLRNRIGPFGTLHILDPGLDPMAANLQRARLATEILPALIKTTQDTDKELELS